MRKIVSVIVCVLALTPVGARALGLGNIEMLSALNQPLEAEIELLSVRDGETDGMIATLGSQEAFLRAGIDRPFILTQLRFDVRQRADGTPFIAVSSKKPVVEPFLNFLIEVDWPRGRLVREYTVLLDPPVFMTQQAQSSEPAKAPVVETEEAAVPSTQVTVQTTTTVEPEPVSVVQTASPEPVSSESSVTEQSTASVGAVSDDEYGPVKKGDTLWAIAESTRPGSVTIEQMMIAISRANQGAFLNDNINLLRQGAILRIPRGDLGISQGEAVAVVQEQTALWNEYRASIQRRSDDTTDTEVASTDADTSAPASESSQTTVETDASELKLVAEEDAGQQAADAVVSERAQEAESALADVQSQLALANEEVEAERLRNEDLQSRLASLEDTVSKMERLITLRETELAELQRKLADSETAAAQVAEAAVSEPVSTDSDTDSSESLQSELTEQIVDEAQEATDSVVEAAADAIDQAVDQVAETLDTEESGTVAEAVSEADSVVVEPEPIVVVEPEPEVVIEPEPAPEPIPTPVVTAPPAPKSFIDNLMGSPGFLVAGGGVLLLLLALLFMMVRRRKSTDDEEDDLNSDLVIDDDELDTVAADASMTEELADELPAAVADAADTDDIGDLDTDIFADLDNVADSAAEDIADEATAMLDTHSTVVMSPAESQEFVGDGSNTLPEAKQPPAQIKDDTIAEADVYLAYGLFGQAEDLLKLAIEENPSKAVYQVKLAETYYAEKNKAAFVDAAERAHGAIAESDPSAWSRIASMGAELAPENELFGGAGPISAVAPELAMGANDAAGFEEELDLDATQLLEAAEYEETRPLDDIDSSKIMADRNADDSGLVGASDALAEDEITDAGMVDFNSVEGGDTVLDDILEGTDSSVDEAMEFAIDELDATGEIKNPLGSDDTDTVLDFENDLDMDLSLEDLGLSDESQVKSEDRTVAEGDPTVADSGANGSGGQSLADIEDDDALSVENDAIVKDASVEGLDETMVLDQEFDATGDGTNPIDDGFDLDGAGEIDTMLDLAKAYIDMGDSDSATSALNEIVAAGNDVQKTEARELLKQLS